MFHGNKGSSAAWPGILNWPCRILPWHGPDGWSPGTISMLRIELWLTHIILNHLGCWKKMQALKLGRQSSPEFILPWAMLGQHLNARPSEYWLGSAFHGPVCLFILDLHPSLTLPPWLPLFFFSDFFLLVYSRLTMSWEFQVSSKGTQPNIHMYPSSPWPRSHPGCHTHYLSSPFAPPTLISSQFLACTPCTPASCLCIMLGHLLGIPLLPLLFSFLLLFKAQPKCRRAYQLPQVSSLAEYLPH